jgi:uncharacterized cupredoxin-like copper-binding protein
MNAFKLAVATTALALALPAAASAEGFLAGRLEKLPDLVIGLGDAGYEFSQDAYNLETGKGYRMWLKATGKKECAFQAADFFQNVWFRKIEVNKVEIKASAFHEIEFEREGEAELFFTPIKPGEYTWSCKGLEDKGLTGKITVK